MEHLSVTDKAHNDDATERSNYLRNHLPFNLETGQESPTNKKATEIPEVVLLKKWEVNYFQPFQVVVSGEIESASLMNCSSWTSLLCQCTAVNNCGWELIEGDRSSVSQVAHSKKVFSQFFNGKYNPLKFVSGEEFCFNFPINLRFKGNQPMGWPRLVLSLYISDWLRRVAACGYGSVHIPMKSGRCMREVHLVQPLDSSRWNQLVNWLSGKRLEVTDPTIFSLPNGRDSLRVQTEGKLKINLNVTIMNI